MKSRTSLFNIDISEYGIISSDVCEKNIIVRLNITPVDDDLFRNVGVTLRSFSRTHLERVKSREIFFSATRRTPPLSTSRRKWM